MIVVEEELSQGVELTANLGTSATKQSRGEIDRRMFTNIDEDDIDWLLYLTLGKQAGNKALELILDNYLHFKIGVGALGMRYAIKGESVKKGIGTSFEDEAPRHNRFSRAMRTIVNPNWEEEERQRLNLE